MGNDCTHPKIKCMKCHRYLEAGTPQQPNKGQPIPTVIQIDGGFLINSGPLDVHVKFNEEGVTVDLFDNTTTEGDPKLDSVWEFYASCEDPWKTLIDPQQQELTL